MTTGSITGTVTKVTKGKGIVQTQHGSFERHNMTVRGKDGKEIVIQKLAKTGTDGSNIVGKHVQVTYTEKEIELENGETFTSRSASSKQIVVIDEATGKPVSELRKSGGYTDNSEGQRKGMIANKGVDLAIARKTLDLQGLREAIRDVKKAVELELETTGSSQQQTSSTNSTTTREPQNLNKVKKQSTQVDITEDEDSPFED